MTSIRVAGAAAVLLCLVGAACSGGSKPIPTVTPTLPTSTVQAPAPVGTVTDRLVGDKCKPASPDRWEGVVIALGRNPSCVVWNDVSDREDGYRIKLRYMPGEEVFIFDVGANITELLLPGEALPGLDRPEFCDRREWVEVSFSVRRGPDLTLVDGFMANLRCRPGP